MTIIYTPASNVFTRGDYATGSGGHHSPASAGARVRARLTDLLLQHRSHVQKRKARQARARPRAGKRDRESVGSPPPLSTPGATQARQRCVADPTICASRPPFPHHCAPPADSTRPRRLSRWTTSCRRSSARRRRPGGRGRPRTRRCVRARGGSPGFDVESIKSLRAAG